MDEENVLDFLTSLEAMDRPDRIEEVNAKILSKIVEDTDFVAVLFCKSTSSFQSVTFRYLDDAPIIDQRTDPESHAIIIIGARYTLHYLSSVLFNQIHCPQ